jgi:hypothetical protein
LYTKEVPERPGRSESAVSRESENAVNQAYPRDAATSLCTTSTDSEPLIKLERTQLKLSAISFQDL